MEDSSISCSEFTPAPDFAVDASSSSKDLDTPSRSSSWHPAMANSLPVGPGLRLDLVSLAMSHDSTFSVSRLAGTLSALLDFFAGTWSASGPSRGGCGFPHPPRVGLNLRSSWRGCSGARILLRLGLCLLSAPTWWRRTLRRDRGLGHLGQPCLGGYHDNK